MRRLRACYEQMAHSQSMTRLAVWLVVSLATTWCDVVCRVSWFHVSQRVSAFVCVYRYIGCESWPNLTADYYNSSTRSNPRYTIASCWVVSLGGCLLTVRSKPITCTWYTVYEYQVCMIRTTYCCILPKAVYLGIKQR